MACQDCPSEIYVSRGKGLFGVVLVVAVEHEDSCPWLARYAPDGTVRATPHGVVMHNARTA
ncbi:hypothetical protein [Streptomyces chiangmaiensis]|uniref:Transposase n=1 Tax=Streptomyces chiangmaiensis TaxID=766497 RepID=A0ABU7FSN4_9ACTN|nr:hypothetical protein [Streptomyces chiangmaiensis]MED7826921.1 hypothetical protein [Streptomyces chiangmaiensis]